MSTSFVVIRVGEGWTVFQDGEPLETRVTKAGAAEIAHLLAVQFDALGYSSTLLVQDDAGELQPWDLNAGVRLLARLYADRRPSPATA
jgi:hypothetical protein